MLLVHIMKLNLNHVYSDDNSSIISRENGESRTTELRVLATRSCLLMLLSVRTLGPGPNYFYLVRNSSIFSREGGRKCESSLSNIDMMRSMHKD